MFKPCGGVSLMGLTGTSSRSTLMPMAREDEDGSKRKFVFSGRTSSSSCHERFEGLCRRCDEGDVAE